VVKKFQDRFSRFDTISAYDRQIDRRTPHDGKDRAMKSVAGYNARETIEFSQVSRAADCMVREWEAYRTVYIFDFHSSVASRTYIGQHCRRRRRRTPPGKKGKEGGRGQCWWEAALVYTQSKTRLHGGDTRTSWWNDTSHDWLPASGWDCAARLVGTRKHINSGSDRRLACTLRCAAVPSCIQTWYTPICSAHTAPRRWPTCRALHDHVHT